MGDRQTNLAVSCRRERLVDGVRLEPRAYNLAGIVCLEMRSPKTRAGKVSELQDRLGLPAAALWMRRSARATEPFRNNFLNLLVYNGSVRTLAKAAVN